MNYTKTLLLFIVFIALKCPAQETLVPLYEIKTDSGFYQLPHGQRQLLEDKEGRLGINEVLTAENSTRFHPDNSNETGIGFSGIKDYWLRFRLRNSLGRDQALVLPVDGGTMRWDLFIIRSNGIREHLKNGWGVPFRERDSIQTSEAFLLRMKDNEEVTIYIKAHLFGLEFKRQGMELSFYSYENYIREDFYSKSKFEGDTKHAFVAGLMFFAFILNIFFYRIVKEKVYLYFALIMLSESIYFWRGTHNLLETNSPLLSSLSFFVLIMIGFVFISFFVRSYLKTAIHYPRLDKLLGFLCIAWVVSLLTTIFLGNVVSKSWSHAPRLIHNLIFFSFYLALFISFLLPKKEKIPNINLAVIAALPILFNLCFVLNGSNLYYELTVIYGTPLPKLINWIAINFNDLEMVCMTWFAVLFTWILLQRYAQVRKELTLQALDREKERVELMEIQKEKLEKQVQERTSELKQSLDNLKNMQQQLVQSEKMASLGALTAGIAHEIQNPLNFVNNFSEVSEELLTEAKGKRQEAKENSPEVEDLLEEIKQNLAKINHHGKRADAIVKGMMQHSRGETGVKEPTDINLLAEEYFRMAYHGQKAKGPQGAVHKSNSTKQEFVNVKLETELDPNAGKVSVVPQDIGRVLLNLFNNAFYVVSAKAVEQSRNSTNFPATADAVDEKQQKHQSAYQPTVRLSTARVDNEVRIMIQDNGSGIPRQIIDKIFQPFFTTKPTGQGTGLGLSLSYDIIKTHHGEIEVSSIEGEGTTFTIHFNGKLT